MTDSISPEQSNGSSSAIDERHAHQLLERTLVLAERGEMQAAVLSCRQAIALTPQSPQGYSMLGLLLERAGDAGGAITAYEKVLQFAPDSVLERESLSRLRVTATQRRTTRELFTFDDNELFADGSTPVAPAAAPAVAATAATATGNGASAPTAEKTPATISAVMSAPGVMSTPSVWPVGVAPMTVDTTVPRPSTSWRKLLERPSVYFRGAPVAAAAAVGLLFLLWTQSYVASRHRELLPVVAGAPAGQNVPEASDLKTPVAEPATPADARRAANASGPVPVNPGTGTASPSTPAAATAAPGLNAGGPATARADAPSTPAPRAATSTPAARPTDDEGDASTLPAPSERAASSPATTGASPTGNSGGGDAGGASASGAPLGPTGASDRNFVRVSPAGGRPVPRPENRAAGDERVAGSEARSGRASAAIERLTDAIDAGGGDVALRLQQRAQLYLSGGDTARAIADFQSAIVAYGDMIERGDRVAIARSGIVACRRGIQVAQSRG